MKGAFVYQNFRDNHVICPGSQPALIEFLDQPFKGIKHKSKNSRSGNSEDALTCHRLGKERRDHRLEELMGKPKRRKEIVLFILDVIFFIAALVPSMPVLVRWFLWICCWTITVVLVQILFAVPRKMKWRILITRAGALFFCACFQSLMRGQWREEKAATLTGELCSFRSYWGTCYTPPIPVIEIADSGTKFVWGGPDAMQMGTFAHNVGLRIEQGKHGIQLSTPLLDRSGKKIVNIEKNHWTVIPPPGIWDKNYTQNSLEIKDSREQVVLQIKFLSGRIQIAVEWRDQFGRAKNGQSAARTRLSNRAYRLGVARRLNCKTKKSSNLFSNIPAVNTWASL